MSKSVELKKALGTDRFWDIVDQKRRARMDKIDQMPPAIRALVHDYGLGVVQAFLDVGVREPRHIRHLVETTLNEIQPDAWIIICTRHSASAGDQRR